MTPKPTNALNRTVYNAKHTPKIQTYISLNPKIRKSIFSKRKNHNDQRFMLICIAILILGVFCIFCIQLLPGPDALDTVRHLVADNATDALLLYFQKRFERLDGAGKRVDAELVQDGTARGTRPCA